MVLQNLESYLFPTNQNINLHSASDNRIIMVHVHDVALKTILDSNSHLYYGEI